jgi:general stress protein CsbA
VALAAALVLMVVLVAVAASMWYVSRQYLARISMARQRRLMRWTTVASVGIGVALLIVGLVASALTGYWLILVPTWSYGLLHINFAVRAWLRWSRRSAAS